LEQEILDKPTLHTVSYTRKEYQLFKMYSIVSTNTCTTSTSQVKIY